MPETDPERIDKLISLPAASCVTGLLFMPADGRSETFHESADMNLSYTGEMWQNGRGGASRGNAYLDNLNISAKIDAEALWGWSDTELFVHGAHGMGTGFGQSGENGPSIFPVTSLSLRFEWHWTRELAMRLAVLDAVPGDPSDPGATVVELNDGEGALVAYELQWGDAARRVLLGAWGYTAGFDEWPRADSGPGNESTGNSGFYIRGEAALGGPGGGVSALRNSSIIGSRFELTLRGI